MRKYVLDRTAVPYFSNIVWYIRDQCQSLDQLLNGATHANKAKLEDFTAELMDYLYYLHDIFNLGIKELSEVLSDQLIKNLLLPQFVGSLMPDDDVVLEDRLSPLLAVFLLAQVFYIFTYKPVVNTIAAALVHPQPSSYSLPHLQRPVSQLETRRMPRMRYSLSDLCKLEADTKKERLKQKLKEEKKSSTAPTTPLMTPSHSHAHNNPTQPNSTQPAQQNTSTVNEPPKTNKFYDTLITFFAEGDSMILAVVCLFYALIRNQSVESSILEVSGLYPFRLYKAKQLLQALTSEDAKNKKEDKRERGATHGRSVSLSGLDYVTHLSSSWADTHPLALLTEEVANKNKSAEGTTAAAGDNRTDDSPALDGHSQSTQPHEQAELNQPTRAGKVVVQLDGKMDYLARVTKDFGISEDEAASLWVKFMEPLLQRQQNETPTVETTEGLPTDQSLPLVLVESGEDRPDPSMQFCESPKVTLHLPETTQVTSNRENTNVHNPPRLVECLLRILLHSNECRLITLQLITLSIKELVYTLDSPPNLSPADFKLLEQAYFASIENLRECLNGSLGDIFLELFEHELKTYKQINFDGLIADTSSLLLPVSATPMSGFALSKRLPSGQAEKIQKAVQIFLVLREFRYTMLKVKDDRLPLKEDPVPPMKPKDLYTFPTDDIPNKNVIPCSMAVGPTKKKVPRYLIIEAGVLLLVEPDARSIPKTSKKEKDPPPAIVAPPTTGHICNTIPLQNIEMEVDKTDDCLLQVISHPTTSQFPFLFENSTECLAAQHRLEKARNKVRANKMRQIHEMLKDDVT